MARKFGEERICDRCGKRQFFECEEDNKLSATKMIYNWSGRRCSHAKFGDLCPECLELYDTMERQFIENFKKLEECQIKS